MARLFRVAPRSMVERSVVHARRTRRIELGADRGWWLYALALRRSSRPVTRVSSVGAIVHRVTLIFVSDTLSSALAERQVQAQAASGLGGGQCEAYCAGTRGCRGPPGPPAPGACSVPLEGFPCRGALPVDLPHAGG